MSLLTGHTLQERICFRSLGDEMVGSLFYPCTCPGKWPAVVVCHGAGEFKENFYELCGFLAEYGVAALALDMHGHGESGGEPYHVNIGQWVADIRAALDFLALNQRIDSVMLGGFGLSSGGTAVLEAALVDARLKALVVLDGTVRNSLARWQTFLVKTLVWLGSMKRRMTGSDLRVPLLKLFEGMRMVTDPELQRRLLLDPRLVRAFQAFPFPGAEQAFFVDTISRVSAIRVPTLVIWGAEDELDPPETGYLLYEALRCTKGLRVVEGNGHAGHLDRNKDMVFQYTADWFAKHLA